MVVGELQFFHPIMKLWEFGMDRKRKNYKREKIGSSNSNLLVYPKDSAV